MAYHLDIDPCPIQHPTFEIRILPTEARQEIWYYIRAHCLEGYLRLLREIRCGWEPALTQPQTQWFTLVGGFFRDVRQQQQQRDDA